MLPRNPRRSPASVRQWYKAFETLIASARPAQGGAMRKATLFSTLLITLLANQLAHPQPVRGEERASLLISEVLTGGTTAVDEYVRIEASGGLPVDLRDTELVYISASGLTTRRLVNLTIAASLAPGGSLLLAHALGSFAYSAQLTWSEGIASSGGVLQLRRVGAPMEILDAVAWGSAALNAGGEGLPAPAPPAGTPLRRARSASGALVDTNMNSADFAHEVPPSPTPSLTPSPSSTPTPAALNVDEARTALVGTQIRVRGVITALPGELAEPLLAALSDPTEGTGLFVQLPPTAAGLLRGQLVEVSGLLTLRRQALTLVATAAPLLVGSVGVPLALAVQRPAPGAWAWETWEGRRIRVEGVLAGSPTSLANGAISLRIRLGSGEELLAAASSSVASTLPTALQEGGRRIRAEGLIHQRGSVGGGGYRLWLDPVIGLTSAPQTSAGGEVVGDSGGVTAPAVPDPLPLGAPTIAVPEGAGRGWLREIVTSLRVDEGRLELWREGVVRLVVLPSCGEPVDHEGEAPYPEPR
jgi:hypothetical protein